MSLDNLKLSPYLLKEMYGNTLIETADEMTGKRIKSPEKKAAEKPGKKNDSVAVNEIKFLGKNNSNILILVNEKEHAFLSDADLAFLLSVLNACKISADDAALVNCFANEDAVYEKLETQFSPRIILFIGTEPQLLGFPVQIPRYRIQQYNRQQYLCAPSLAELAANKEEKKQLWNALKQLFEIS